MATRKRPTSKSKAGAKPKAKPAGRTPPPSKPSRSKASPVEAPAPAPAPRRPASDRERERLALVDRERQAKGREIGSIPPIGNVPRRRECLKSLRLFCETYNPEAFRLGWSADHLRVIARIEEAAWLGALYALAMPRGSGKSTICRHGALWVVCYSICRYPFLIGANADKAQDTLDTVKTLIRFLPAIAEDFPELAHPARALGGIANRASGQTCGGVSTLIEWAGDRVVLPTVPPPPNWDKDCSARALRPDGMAPSSGIVVSTSGLTGDGIRGSLLTLSTGELLRPDFVLIDDPQTDESARSKTQNATRLKLISADVLGMAGPGKQIAAVMPCTVIARGDAADEVLDRSKHPLWRGERMALLPKMPTDLKAWEAYFEVYDRCALKEPPDYAEANAYYIGHQAELDAGAEAAWPERKLETEVSAVQHAMHLYHRDKWAFFSEYQNAPLDESTTQVARKLDAGDVGKRLTRVPRRTVPRECTRLTAFVDCGKDLLWYAVVGWDERWNGGVVDYGTWPRQPVPYFAKANPPRSLQDMHPGLDDEQLLYAALRGLMPEVLGKAYPREGGGELAVELCLVDEGYKDKPVYQFCRESEFHAVLMPSKGHVPKSFAASPMSGWQARTGERAAKPGQPSWRVGPVGTGKGRHALFEANEWKTFLAARLTAAPGGGGALRLFGEESTDHRMLADHCTAEFAVEVWANGRRFERWEARPNQDNDLFDCLVGCAVAAGVRGLEFHAGGERPAQPKVAGKKWSEIQREKMQARGGVA